MDRLGWTVGKVFLAYGVYFGVRSNSSEIMDRIAAVLPPGTKEVKPRKVDTIFSFLYGGESGGGVIKRFNMLYRNHRNLARVAGQVESLLEQLRDDIQLCIAEMAETRSFLHSGVVGWGNRAILIPGRSESGKSTLVRAFIDAGAVFYSDEYAVIDKHTRVHPFPRPIHIRQGAGQVLEVTAEDLGGVTGRTPLPIGLVILSEYQPGGSWRPRQIADGRAVLKLLLHSVGVRRQPDSTIRAATQIVGAAPVVAGPRGPAPEVVKWCIERLSAPDQ